MMCASPNLTLGVEAEFLNLDSAGRIRNLNGKILRAGDVVGTDGHSDTIEIRTEPSHTALDQFQRVANAICKYVVALKRARSPSLMSPGNTFIRAGAYYVTPLSIHTHFGNFCKMDRVELAIQALHKLLYTEYLCLIDSEAERSQRAYRGYGGTGHKGIRIKGKEWWEWREPFSCLTPQHLMVLLVSAEVIGRAVLTAPDAVAKVLKTSTSPTPEMLLQQIGPRVLSYDCTSVAAMAAQTRKLGRINWTIDLLPLWLKEGCTYVLKG